MLACMLAAGEMRAELIKVSPFLPPQGAAANPTANAPLEYRGSYEVGNVEQYRIVDPARKAGAFLKVGERDDNLDISLKQHDANSDTVVVEHGGQTLTLSLRVAKVISSGAVPQMLAPPPIATSTPNVLPAVTQTVVPNPTQADEQRRLEAVAAEVARRRALREQAAQQQAQQAGGQPQAGQPMRQGQPAQFQGRRN